MRLQHPLRRLKEVITDDITSTDKELDNNKASKTGNSSNNAAEPEVTRTTVGNSQSPSNPAVTEPTNTPAVTEGTTKPPTVRRVQQSHQL